MSCRSTITLLVLLFPVMLSAQRWKQVALPAPYDQGYYLDIYFLPSDPQKGWACDNDSGYVVRTTNGGASWTGTRIGTPGQRCHLEYIQFFSNNVGYTSGPCGVYKSLDGGATWAQVTLPGPAGSTWGAWFRDANEGWVTGGGCGYNRFLRTTDGGQTFTEYVDTNIKRSNLSDPLWQADMPAGRLYAIGNGTLWKTDDDGLTWGVQSYTGANSPWHEEIARFGNTFMVPNATSNCPTGGYAGGGVRTSVDGGDTWTEFNIGSDMYGTFLLSAQKGWAAGWNANVWYTGNAGTNWTKKNCGLNGAHTDDLWFMNDTTGWVCGDGLFHLAPPLRTVSDSLLVFSSTCPDSSRFDTIWVENINFNASPWESEFVGPEDYMFRVVNILPPILPACSLVPVIIEYRALQTGAHNASYVIRINDPDTVLIVNLQGSRRTFTAMPQDTLVVIRQRAGSTANRALTWSATGAPSEAISSITPMTGDTTIIMTATLPLVVPPSPLIAQTFIEATPADTGWTQQRFKVTLAPCNRDTFVTVRLYGESPIMNSITQLTLDAKCKVVDTLRIPIWNTGNLPLKVLSVRFEGVGTLPFRFLGYSSKRALLTYALPVGESDTMLVEYALGSGDDAADMVIENDDATKKRGDVTKWRVALHARSQRPVFVITPLVIDAGTLCAGQRLDSTIVVENKGSSTFSVRTTTSSTDFVGFTGSSSSISPRTDRKYRFQWVPTRTGAISDTIWFRISPCDTVVPVIVRATVPNGGIIVTPSPLIDSIPIGQTLQRRITISTAGSDTIVITSIDHLPAGNDVTLNIPTLPFTLTNSVTLDIDVTWTPLIVTRSQTQLVINSQGACGGVSMVDIDLSSYDRFVNISKDSIALGAFCSAAPLFDTIRVTSLRDQPTQMSAPTFRTGSDAAFSVISPTTSVNIPPRGVQDVVVRYDPALSLNAVGELVLTFPDDASEISIPTTAIAVIPNWTVNTPPIDADTMASCDTAETFPIELVNAGTTDEVVDVNTSTLPIGFTVAPQQVVVPAGSNVVVLLRIDPAQIPLGRINSVVEFTGQTCGDVRSVAVTVFGTGGRLVMTPDPVDAGTIAIGKSISLPVTITNPTSMPRRIISLDVNPTLSSWTLEENVVNEIINAGASRVVNIRFVPTLVGDASTRLVLVDAERCTTVTSIALIGRGREPDPPPQHAARLRIDRFSVPPESRVKIPIHWDSDVSAAGLDSAEINITFSYLSLTVDSVTVGTMSDVALESTFTNGAVQCRLTSTGPTAGSRGVVGYIYGVAHSALPDSTLLVFESVQVMTNEPAAIETKNGVLIVDACGPRNMIVLVSPTTVSFMPPHPVSDVIHMKVVAPFHEVMKVEIVSVIGDVASVTENIMIDKGETVVSLPVQHLQTGTYLVRVTTRKGGEFSEPVVIVR